MYVFLWNRNLWTYSIGLKDVSNVEIRLVKIIIFYLEKLICLIKWNEGNIFKSTICIYLLLFVLEVVYSSTYMLQRAKHMLLTTRTFGTRLRARSTSQSSSGAAWLGHNIASDQYTLYSHFRLFDTQPDTRGGSYASEASGWTFIAD
jgi:hypothetical protein